MIVLERRNHRAAKAIGCDTILSEDLSQMQDDDGVPVINSFRKISGHVRNERSCKSEPVGRTPWSAAGPLAGLLRRSTKADEGVGRGPGGPPHHSEPASFEAIFNRVCADESG